MKSAQVYKDGRLNPFPVNSDELNVQAILFKSTVVVNTNKLFIITLKSWAQIIYICVWRFVRDLYLCCSMAMLLLNGIWCFEYFYSNEKDQENPA